MGRLASLSMYDLPELRTATERWWQGLAGHFRDTGVADVPDLLSVSPADRDVLWLSPNLIFSQTCGYPLARRLGDRVKLIATPCYDAPGCEGPNYRSLLVVRQETEAEDLAALAPCRVAVNGFDSHSGWNAMKKHVDPLGGWERVFPETLESGGHVLSIDMVREGKADVAAIDCVTHALTSDTTPKRLAGTRVLEATATAPGLPYITANAVSDAEVELMRQGLSRAISDPALAEVRASLRLVGFEVLPPDVYVKAMN